MIVSVEGLIGAGKTTLLNHLELQGFKVLREPVEKWSFLEKFYKDIKYSLPLQLQIMLTFKEQEEQLNTNDIVFVERSPDVSRHVFATMMHSEGILTDDEFNAYSRVYDLLKPWKPDVYVYLECPIDLCISRQHSRDDAYKLDIEYIENLKKQYEIFFKNTPRISIDSTKPVKQLVDDILEKIRAPSFRGYS